ncbi:MAG: crotonase/enoyl-CoA hydratase family protein [SAR324 cluster bacterium]|nr:crotonase/enoyl-CoA hydratase family protein [SAR324 cluster bacterium]
MDDYETLTLTVEEKIAHVAMDRPGKSNAMNAAFWKECRQLFRRIDEEAGIRVAVVSGNGRHFSAGIDLEMLGGLLSGEQHADRARQIDRLRNTILEMQESFTAIDHCRVPVIAAIHGGCIGGGVDMIAACDMRYCTANAFFVIKEVDVGLAADMGTLQRLPHIVGDGMMRELAYTGRKVTGPEAKEIGLVNRVFEDKQSMMDGVMAIAREIARKPPLAVRGTKQMIRFTRDHTVAEGLDYVATWNAGMISELDVREAIEAQVAKRVPAFED